MAAAVKNLIEIAGLTDRLPLNPTAFKQLNIQGALEMPETKPGIGQIARIKAQAVIICTKVINTTIGASLEGQVLTGKKLVVQGEIRQKVEYAADECTQSVHAVHFNTPFSTFIVLPETFNTGAPVTVTPHIENIFIDLIDKRTIFSNLLLFLDAL